VGRIVAWCVSESGAISGLTTAGVPPVRAVRGETVQTPVAAKADTGTLFVNVIFIGLASIRVPE
jgi:hypothetical protein